MRLLRLFSLMLAVALSAPFAVAAGGSTVPLVTAPIERTDFSSLQRGASTFINYCSGCHSATYIRYGRIAEDLGIPAEILRTRLIYNEAGLADGITSAMNKEEATEWFHQAAPPDLSLSAKLRGNDWLYTYLRSFYLDSSRPSGWNNSTFPNVAMPHVLAGLQGEVALNDDGSQTIVRAGRLSAAEYDATITDLVNFMDYIAEPGRDERYRAGYIILSLLFALFMCTYFLYREYWHDVS